MAGAWGPAAQRAGNALWGGRACPCLAPCLAPACGRKLARSAGHAPGVEDSLRLVSQVDEPGPVRPLAGGCGPPTPPREGPPGQASPELLRPRSVSTRDSFTAC